MQIYVTSEVTLISKCKNGITMEKNLGTAALWKSLRTPALTDKQFLLLFSGCLSNENQLTAKYLGLILDHRSVLQPHMICGSRGAGTHCNILQLCDMSYEASVVTL